MEVRQSILALLILFNLLLTLVYLTTWNSFVRQNFYWKHGNIVKLSCVNLEAAVAWEQSSFWVAVGRLPRLRMLDKYWLNWSSGEWLINLSTLSLFFLIKSHWAEEHASSSVSFGLPAGAAASIAAHLAVGMLLCEGAGRQLGVAAPWQAQLGQRGCVTAPAESLASGPPATTAPHLRPQEWRRTGMCRAEHRASQPMAVRSLLSIRSSG